MSPNSSIFMYGHYLTVSLISEVQLQTDAFVHIDFFVVKSLGFEISSCMCKFVSAY